MFNRYTNINKDFLNWRIPYSNKKQVLSTYERAGFILFIGIAKN
jgi:hypothetical protein